MLTALLLSLVLAGGPAAAPPCDPIKGAEQLWAKPETRFVFIGETHGTREAPAAFADLVCLASRDRRVLAAIELPSLMQADLEAFVSANAGSDAEAALFRHPLWKLPFGDGRTSQAMVEMLLELRRLKSSGRDITVTAFQPSGTRRPEGFDQSYYELEMAHLLSQAAQAQPDALVLVLAGNLHSRKSTNALSKGALAAAGHLNSRYTVSVNMAAQGGDAWACMGDGPPQQSCRSHPSRPVHDPSLRGVILQPDADGHHDGLISLGPTRASPPYRHAP